MRENEFWCRAFLAAMQGSYLRDAWDNHGAPATYCERAADAALEAAQRRGMVAAARDGACRAVALPPPDDRPCTPDELRQLRRVAQIACAWTCGGHDGERLLREAVSEWWHAEGVRLDAAMRGEQEAPGPELERVEFKAWPVDGGQWRVQARGIGAILMPSGCDQFNVNGASVRIKWGESMPPQPIEVWIERPAKGETR